MISYNEIEELLEEQAQEELGKAVQESEEE